MTKEKLFKKIRQIVLVFGLISIAAYVGYRFGQQNRIITSQPDPKADLSSFWLVWNTLEEKYLNKDNLNSKKMVQGAISGLVDSLGDPYTVYLPPEDNEVTQQNLTGTFGGIGIQLGYKNNQLAVISPLKETPAEKAGIKAGDYILRIVDENNGIDRTTEDVTLPEAVKLIRGEIGNKITLTLSRESKPEPFEVEVVRGKIEIPALETSWKSAGNKEYAYVHLLQFSELMNQEWENWVNQVVKRKADPQFGGVILDLRNNPGGYLNGAVYVAGEFLNRGKIVVWQEDYRGTKEKFEVQRRGNLLGVPLVVLVNGGSASASEILAGALKQYQRAEVIGQTTFGKGTIQEPQQLPDNAGLHITTSRWLLPDETSVHDQGLEPDIKVELTEEEVETENGSDKILEKALEVLNEKD